jgi:hypothetical protein
LTEGTSVKLNSCYFELPDLLLYRQKIIKAYQNSREDWKVAYKLIANLEEFLGEFKGKYSVNLTATARKDAGSANDSQSPDGETLTKTDLEKLKRKLNGLLKIALEASQLQRNLEYYRNTIATNTGNYQKQLNQLQELSQDDLSFFKGFEQESQTYQEQIQSDLNYFVAGFGLLDRVIDTIRGLVEITQAEREQNLQNTLQALGFGLGAAGLIASNAPYLIKQDPELYKIAWPFTSNQLHPFSIVLLISLGAGVGVWLLAMAVFNRRQIIAQVKQSFLRFKPEPVNQKGKSSN